MLGFTISSPNYSEIAEKSRKAFMKHTGLNAFVLHTQFERNYLAKLQITRWFDQTIVFFDSDLRFVKNVDLSPYDNREEFFAVKDCEGHPLNAGTWEDAFSYKDCKNLNMNPDKYFNGGFMIFNKVHHEHIFENALEHIRTKPDDFADFGEQSAVNYAVQNSDTKLELLPVNYNVMVGGSSQVEDICDDPFAIHVAGTPLEAKEGELKRYTDVYAIN